MLYIFTNASYLRTSQYYCNLKIDNINSNKILMLELFYNPMGYNTDLFLLLNHLTNISVLPIIFQAISSVFFIANFAAAYLATCIYFYYKAKKANDPTAYFEPIYYELTRIGIYYALFGISFAALKFSVNLPRPFCSLPVGDFITITNISIERCLSSFPSAHTGLSILVTYCLWPHINKALKTLMCTIILSVALSRITLAMHYPADIIYSAMITILVIIIGNCLYRTLKKPILIPIKNTLTQLLFY